MADSATKYDDGQCGSIKNGRNVEVKGHETAQGTIRAVEIKMDDDDD